MLSNLLHNGWSAECVEVVVIDPELETWLCSAVIRHVARVFRYNGPVSLRPSSKLKVSGLRQH